MSLTGVPTGDDRSVLRGISFLVICLAVFSIMDAISKFAALGYPVGQIMFVRYVFQFAVLAVAFRHYRMREIVTSRRPFLQIGRALGNVVSTYMFIFALVYVPLADATAIGFVAPLLVTALSVPLLGEKVGVRRWSAVVIGFLGALVILRPGLGVMHWSSFLLLGSAFIYATYQIATRVLSVHDKPITTLFYTSTVGLTASAFLAPFGWQPMPLTMWGLLAIQGAIAATAHFLLIKAFEYAPVSTLAPFSYLQIIGTTALGFVLFAEFPDRWTIVGASIIVGSGMYVIYRETTLIGRRRAGG